MKKIITVLILASVFALSGCGAKDKEIANEYMAKVNQLEDHLPTMQEVKELDSEYYNLTSKQKDLVSNYGIVKKYLSLDLDKINTLQEKINSCISQTSIPYKEVIEIENNYKSLTSEEQSYIKDIDELQKFKELDEWDKAAIVAVNFLKGVLKDGDSLEVDEINIKKEGFYYVKINYSATNSFGGRKEDTACIDITTEYKSGLIALSLLFGDFDESSNTLLGGYIGFDVEEHPVDCDKIMDNFDVDIENESTSV